MLLVLPSINFCLSFCWLEIVLATTKRKSNYNYLIKIKFYFIMKKLEVSDFWLWFSNSRMLGLLHTILNFPSWMQMTTQILVLCLYLRQKQERKVEPAPPMPFIYWFFRNHSAHGLLLSYLWVPLLQGSLEKHIFSFENRKRKIGKMASGLANPEWIPYFLTHLIPSLFFGHALGLIFATISRGTYHSAEYLEYKGGQLYG